MIRLGYITFSERPEWRILNTITKSEHEEILKHTRVLSQYTFNKNLFKVFLSNFNEFLDNVPSMLEICIKTPNSTNDLYFNCNRLMINLLTSFRSYLDYTELYLKRKYGNKSPEYCRFQKLTNELYDKNFSYRFIYKLRNFSQHCGFPIGRLSYSAKEEPVTLHQQHSINVSFDRDELLLQYDGWGKLKTEIITQAEEFDALPIIKHLREHLWHIRKLILIIDKESLRDSVTFIKDVISTVNVDNGTVCIFSDFKMTSEKSLENSKFSVFDLGNFLAAFMRNI